LPGTDPHLEKGSIVPKPPVPAAVAEFLAQPNYATISTLRADGQPVSVPTWYMYENGRILVNMDEGRKRLEYLRHDPRVSLSAMDPQDWITHVSIQGRVVEFVDDPDLTDIDRISVHYTGNPYHQRDRRRVSVGLPRSRSRPRAPQHPSGAVARSERARGLHTNRRHRRC
jgi:PPOX class probable F420-dependent enzyme